MPEKTNGNDASQAITAEPKSAEQKPLNPLEFDEESIAKLLGEIDPSLKPETAEQPPPAEAEPEAEAETEAQSEDETEPDLSQPEQEVDQPEPEEEHDRVQKRIDQLTAKRREAEEKATALERELQDAKSQLQELQSNPASTAASGENPLSNVWDETKLQQEWQNARNLKRWCEDHPEGAEINGREYTAESVKEIKRKVEDAMEIHIPERADFLQKFKQINPKAEADFPWWKDRTSKEYAEATNALRSFPPLAARPDYKIILGWLIEGKKAVEARMAAAAAPKPKPAPKPAPRQPSTPAAAPARQNPNDRKKLAERNFFKTGTVKELERLVEELDLVK